MTWKRIFLIVCFLLATSGARADSPFVLQPLRVLLGGDSGVLEALFVRPNEPGRYPLALLAHGSPRTATERPNMTPLGMLPQALEFARRGWAVVIVMRRGYGGSDGGWAEGYGSCDNANYAAAGVAGGADLKTTLEFVSHRPDVDPTRMIAVGVSAGGFATVALTADPPAGLVAAISFAGGRGSRKPDEVCNPEVLVRAFYDFGKTSHVPMLWVYAENDHFFGPSIAAQFYSAFTAAGGKAEFVKAAAFRRDGHGLFSMSGTAIWTPLVESFLARQNLTLRTSLLALPAPPDVAPPAALSENGTTEFRSFLTLPGHKAFAMTQSGAHYGFAYARRTEKEAAKMAEEHCKEGAGSHDPCAVVMVDEQKTAN